MKSKIHNVKLKSKLAQMKIQQMAFMLIAVTLFFAFAGMFVLMIMLSGYKETAAAINEKDALLLVSKLSNSPEFNCGNSISVSPSHCVDFYKLNALENNRDKYGDFWGVSGVELMNIHQSTSKVIIVPTVAGTGVSNFVSSCMKVKSGMKRYDADWNETYQLFTVDVCHLAKIIVTYD